MVSLEGCKSPTTKVFLCCRSLTFRVPPLLAGDAGVNPAGRSYLWYMKRMVIIGCGAGILSSKKKDFIDDSDLVVRVNNFKIKGYEDYVGTKTDIYSCAPKFINSIDKSEEQRIKDCVGRYEEELVSHPGLELHKDLYIKIYTHPQIDSNQMKEIVLSYLPGNVIVKAEKELHPDDKFPFERLPFSSKMKIANFGFAFQHTTGFRTILYCLKTYPDYEIFVTGFDFFLKSGWYWDMGSPWTKQHTNQTGNMEAEHAFYLENERLRQMIQKGQVKEI